MARNTQLITTPRIGDVPPPAVNGKSPLKTATPNVFSAEPSSTAFGLNIGTVVQIQNHWREYYNPLRALDLQRYIALYDFSRRGLNAELQNVYREMEQLFPALIGLIARRTAPLLTREFTVKTIDPKKFPKSATQAMADAQAETLSEAYAAIDNLDEAVEWMELAPFRGVSHLEKIYANPGSASDWTVSHLEPVEQWHWTRKSMYAEWEYVAAATQTNCGIPIDYNQFVIREAPWALDRLALLLWIRANLAEKDWDGFVELYGIPRWVVIMPPNVPKEQETEYKGAARSVAEGASGALPNGSDLKISDPKTEGTIFKQRLDHINEQLVLAGTGGKLTMLSAPTGIGKGATDEHADAFDEIGDREAIKISKCFQRQFDKPILDREFPGQPVLAYVELASPKQTDVTQFCADVLSLSQAGYEVDPAQIVETTGYEVTLKPQPDAPDSSDDPAAADNKPSPNGRWKGEKPGKKKLKNREVGRGSAEPSEEFLSSAARDVAQETQSNLAHGASRVRALLEIKDDALREAAIKNELKKWPDVMADSLLAADSAALEKIIATAFASGLQTPVNNRMILNDGPPDQPRDRDGRFAQQRRGEAAMSSVLSEKRDVAAAMTHPEFGDVDFRYGDDKSGIAHVVAKHGEETARKIPAIIAHGTGTKGRTRAFIEHEGHKVILSNNWHGQPSNHWVVSAYEKGGNR